MAAHIGAILLHEGHSRDQQLLADSNPGHYVGACLLPLKTPTSRLGSPPELITTDAPNPFSAPCRAKTARPFLGNPNLHRSAPPPFPPFSSILLFWMDVEDER